MNEKYFPEVIEKKWQQHWQVTRAFEVSNDDPRPKFYCLEMLPYPSGFLHMGHVRNYSIGDALAWYKRLQGFNVLHPIGWDSFGQPAEQAAIKRGVNPRTWTEENIVHMRGQLQRLGVSYDWSREIAAHRPDYYKWDQWFFLKMFERGLAYKKLSPVNWCPREGTVLSNEQSSGGVCWRCGAAVEKRDLQQWFLRITEYAEQLVADTAEIEATWPEKVIKRQRDWVGRSEGAYIDFGVKDSDKKIRVFTTRIDTIFGATAVVLAPDHPLLAELLKGSGLQAEVKQFAERVAADRKRPADETAEEIKEGIVYADNGVTVSAFEVDHGGEELPAFGYRIDFEGHSAVLSGDTTFNRNLIDHSRDADLLVHEVTAAAGSAAESVQQLKRIGANHTTPDQAGQIFAEAKPKLAIYNHLLLFGGAKAEDLIPMTRKNYSGPLVVGEDLLQINVGSSVEALPYDDATSRQREGV